MSICSTAISHEDFRIDGTMKPIAVTFASAKKLSGLGLTTLWGLAKEKRIETVRVGRRTLITFRSLEALLLPSHTSAPQVHGRGRPKRSHAERNTP